MLFKVKIRRVFTEVDTSFPFSKCLLLVLIWPKVWYVRTNEFTHF